MSALPSVQEFADLRVDVVPVVKLRPVLTPPRSFNDTMGDPIFAYWNPYIARVELLAEDLTLFPFARQTKDGPLIFELGSAMFVGRHLVVGYPDKLPERLRRVLYVCYGQDLDMGLVSHWIATRGVATSAEPPQSTRRLFDARTPTHKPVPG